jgi:peptidoglycan hydrolase CwlO-like protein
MAKRKRASSRSSVLNRAVKVGRSYLRQAERRLPPDVRKQIDRSIKDGQKTVEGALKQLRTRLDRTANQVDLERALKRLDSLSKQVQQLARSATSRATAPAPATAPARRATRRPATRRAATKPAAAKPVAKPAAKSAAKPAAKRPAAPKPATRSAAPRRRAAAPTVTPPTAESPSMAIPDPSPREPAG